MSNLFDDEVFKIWKDLEIPEVEHTGERLVREKVFPNTLPTLAEELLSAKLSKRMHPLDEINSLLRKSIILKSDSHYYALTLWIAYCHVISEFDFSPRLGIWSPEKRCGKSLLLEIIQQIGRAHV